MAITYHSQQILSAAILTLNSAPVTLVAAQGANKHIVPLRVIWEIEDVGTPYDTNTDINLIIDTAANYIFNYNSPILKSTVDKICATPRNFGVDNNSSQLLANKALLCKVLSGDPLNGDGDLTVHLWYDVLTIT